MNIKELCFNNNYIVHLQANDENIKATFPPNVFRNLESCRVEYDVDYDVISSKLYFENMLINTSSMKTQRYAIVPIVITDIIMKTFSLDMDTDLLYYQDGHKQILELTPEQIEQQNKLLQLSTYILMSGEVERTDVAEDIYSGYEDLARVLTNGGLIW